MNRKSIFVTAIISMVLVLAFIANAARYEDFNVTKLRIQGTQVTSTAAELNKLHGADAGDIVTTTNTKTLSGKIIAGLKLGIATKALSNFGTWVLSAADQLCTLLVASSGSGSIIAPYESGRVYIVRNGTVGNVVIGISPGTTGATIASGKTATVIFYNGDYRRVTGDATH